MQQNVYEPPHETETIGQTSTQPRINVMFPRSIHGIVKIIELTLTLICFFCITAAGYTASTTGWLNFVAATTFVISMIIFLLYFFHMATQLPGPWVIIVRCQIQTSSIASFYIFHDCEFAVLSVSSFFFFLSMIIAAAAYHTSDSGRIATAIFFAFVAIAYAAECILRFRVYKQDGHFAISSTNVNTTRRDPVNQPGAMPNTGTASMMGGGQTGSMRPDYVGQDEYVMP
ncbi:hypothetical protein Ciccas_004396 [Cichlidogyrus casuarinus]|uniref:MARVEL domain-containing protein n=1 Tax=Cichlidogyrus casuarinus TaxID=1844966 RepID=A0ABD2QBP8_9PLAT